MRWDGHRKADARPRGWYPACIWREGGGRSGPPRAPQRVLDTQFDTQPGFDTLETTVYGL